MKTLLLIIIVVFIGCNVNSTDDSFSIKDINGKWLLGNIKDTFDFRLTSNILVMKRTGPTRLLFKGGTYECFVSNNSLTGETGKYKLEYEVYHNDIIAIEMLSSTEMRVEEGFHKTGRDQSGDIDYRRWVGNYQARKIQ